MCGRIACLLDPSAVCRAATAALPNNQQPTYNETGQTFYPSANIMPSRTCLVMYQLNGALVVQPMIWGLIPVWSKTLQHGLTTNNARIETIKTSKLYSRLLNKSRCIVLAQGFYEWKSVNAEKKKPKQPYFIYQSDQKPTHVSSVKVEGEDEVKLDRKQDDKKSNAKKRSPSPKKVKAKAELKSEVESDAEEEKSTIEVSGDSTPLRLQWIQPSNWDGKRWRGPKLLLMAGLYDVWKQGETDEIYSFTVITMASNNTLDWLHDRMPAILETQEQCEMWLDCSIDVNSVLQQAAGLQHYAVDIKVNNSRCHDDDAMDQMKESKEKPQGEASFMQNWLKRKAETKDVKPKKAK